MRIEQLEELAKKGNLILHKYGNQRTRRKYIYSKEEDILDQKLIRIEDIPYTRYQYLARSKDMPKYQNYKITSKDYKLLLKAGATEEK